MKTITLIFIYLTLFFSSFFLKGTHIIGGTASYQVINVTNDMATLHMEFYLYRDVVSSAQFDDSISIGLFGYANEEYEYISKQTVLLLSESVIEFEDIEACPMYSFHYVLGIYAFQFDVPLDDFEHYTFAYQRCCRGQTITNIFFPAETGIAITLDIYPKAFELPDLIKPLKTSYPVQIEPGKTTDFDISLEDNFDKEYFLSAPKASGGMLGSGEPGDPNGCQGIIPDPINCPPDYADVLYIYPNQPYGHGAELELDISSGILTANIPETSKVLVGVTLERSVDDELVCRTRQQFIINSVNCDPLNIDEFEVIDFTISPVPAKESIHFSVPLKQIRIYSSDGMEVSKSRDNNYATQFDISHLPNGIYIVRGLSKDGKWGSKKIIKLKS